MSKRKKLACTLALAGLLGGFWLFLRRDSYITDTVQKYGSALLGVTVTLKGSHLDVVGQSIELRGLAIGNPEGYKSRYLLQLDRITVGIDVSSLTRDVILIREITILKPEVTYEKIRGISNVDVIQRNVDNAARSILGAPAPGYGAKKAPEKRWIISDVVVRDGKALVLTNLVLTNNLSVSLPNLHLRDIGKRTNGATTADATKQVMRALTASISSSVGSAIAGAAKGISKELGKGVKNLGGALNGLFSH